MFGQLGLVPVVCFAQMVETGIWVVWAGYHAPYTQFLPRTARKELNVRDHSFKTSACLRGVGVSPCADGPKVTVHKDQKSPS